MRGGKRINAGRPRGKNSYGEATKPIRIPLSLIPNVYKFIAHKGFSLPLFSSKVQAGFPSPAEDYQEGHLDLNNYLIQHPAATFFVRVAGDSMIGAGIFANDLLIVDRSLSAQSGKIVIAVVNGDFTVKRLEKTGNKIRLLPENPEYPAIEITEESECQIWGVVTNVIHSV
ncbi:MAG: LexA family protein [Gammaproteobacteria bacterium]